MSGNGVPMPVGGHASRNSAGQFPYPAMGGFAGPRSPPKTKNTSHVPCKFYPYGTCQAGAACQFSHDLDPTTQNAPCKYFTKGSCKFGQNCALAHILPDGRVINRPPRGQQFAYGRRMNGQNNLPPMPQSSLISMQANDPLAQQALEYEMAKEGQLSPRFGPTTSNIPKLDTSYTPDPIGSNYGSPLNESRLAASPVQRGLSVLDAPLPSSFDSQGISHAARHGPLAASMPPRFGIESPPSSLPNKALLGNTALRDLHDSAFGDRKLDGVLHGLGSSPPTFEESSSFNKRSLHSERFARHKMLSASLGARQGSFFPMDTSSTEESDDETPVSALLSAKTSVSGYSALDSDDDIMTLQAARAIEQKYVQG
ncbi:hypothetical protein M8818_004543 [Zalaria obscura]|uniref:Uncharacterized protein n=1 Tax=Zalaria obscura TaxID=2024903 RepID=A0ACC3SBF3_9PEZI